MTSRRNLHHPGTISLLLIVTSLLTSGCKNRPQPIPPPPQAASNPDPTQLTRFLTNIRQLIFRAQIERNQGPHDLILEPQRHYRLVRTNDPAAPVLIDTLSIPPELEILSSPQAVRFLRNGRLQWSGPDILDITPPRTDRGDITVRLIGTDQYGLIDLIPESGRIQLLIKSYR